MSVSVSFIIACRQECIDQLAVYEKDYEVDYVIMRFRLPAGPEHHRVPDCIRLFGEEVLPKFHRA